MEEGRDRIAREIEILGLKHEAAEAVGAELTSYEAEDAPLEVREAFWQNVVSYENTPWTTHRAELARDGVPFTPPEQLDDGQLTETLWLLIRALAARSTYLHHTDHLSDRKLYTWLCGEGLTEETKAFPPGSGWNCHLDISEIGSDADNQVYLRYYADEKERERWQTEFPDDAMPEHAALPFDRDRLLPQAVYAVFTEDENDFDYDYYEDAPG